MTPEITAHTPQRGELTALKAMPTTRRTPESIRTADTARDVTDDTGLPRRMATMTSLDYTEIIEDTELKTLIDSGNAVTFRVIEDEWNDDYTMRVIKNAQIQRDTPSSR